MRTKTRTVPLRRRDYIWGAGEVSITRSFCRVLVSTHWTEPEAWRMWSQQVLPIFALESAADDAF